MLISNWDHWIDKARNRAVLYDVCCCWKLVSIQFSSTAICGNVEHWLYLFLPLNSKSFTASICCYSALLAPAQSQRNDAASSLHRYLPALRATRTTKTGSSSCVCYWPLTCRSAGTQCTKLVSSVLVSGKWARHRSGARVRRWFPLEAPSAAGSHWLGADVPSGAPSTSGSRWLGRGHRDGRSLFRPLRRGRGGGGVKASDIIGGQWHHRNVLRRGVRRLIWTDLTWPGSSGPSGGLMRRRN